MELFQITNQNAFPSPHALLIEPFKTIWEEDETPNKGEAVKIFTYIELVCSPKKSNPFVGYSEEDRPAKVREEVWKDPNFKHPKFQQIIQGVLTYKKLLHESSATYELFNSAMNAADKLRKFLNEVDLQERTNGGTAVYKPGDLTRALKEVPEVIKSLSALKDKVHTELEEASKTRNQREIGLFER